MRKCYSELIFFFIHMINLLCLFLESFLLLHLRTSIFSLKLFIFTCLFHFLFIRKLILFFRLLFLEIFIIHLIFFVLLMLAIFPIMCVNNWKIVLKLTFGLKVGWEIRWCENFIQKTHLTDDEILHYIELLLVFYKDFCTHLFFYIFVFVVYIFRLKITLVNCFKNFVLLLAYAAKNDCSNFYL